MGDVNLDKELQRIPQQDMMEGVCAGIAHYFGVPVKLIRVLVMLSVFFGLALLTLVAYIVLTFVLDPMPNNVVSGEQQPSSGEPSDAVGREPAASEKCLREMERYVTSGIFSLHSHFR